LFACGGNFGLEVGVASLFFVEVEATVVNFLSQGLKGHEVGLVASFEIVVGEELFVM
jgi:hypothetical protein